MEMHQVRYFLAVSETLNFTRAAERCNVTQPTLTAGIKKLEEELGAPLFRRERNRSHLTDLGRLVRPHLERILASTEAVQSDAVDFRDLVKASLRLGVMSTIGPTRRMIRLLGGLNQDIPNLEIALIEAHGDDLVAQLLAGDLDVALVGLPRYPERLDAEPLFVERYAVAFCEGHRFENMMAVPFAELDSENYLLRVNCECRQYLDALGVPRAYEANVKFQSEREDWVQAMICAGMGCAVVPEFLSLLPGIATRVLIEPEVSRTISLVTVAGRRYSPVVQVLVRHARNFADRKAVARAAGLGLKQAS